MCRRPSAAGALAPLEETVAVVGVSADNFVRFWFHYVYPYKGELELDNRQIVLDEMGKDFTKPSWCWPMRRVQPSSRRSVADGVRPGCPYTNTDNDSKVDLATAMANDSSGA